MFYDEYLTELSDTEVNRWIWLRSIEWANWPIFISQALMPFALLVFKWWFVLVVLYAINIVWSAVRYKYFNPYLATIAARIAKLKWTAAIGLGVYFFIHNDYELSMLATFWPLLCVGMLLSGNLERIHMVLTAAIGYHREVKSYGFPDAVRRAESPIEKKKLSWLDSEIGYHSLKTYR